MLMSFNTSYAATTTVKGQERAYAGKSLCLYTWDDGWGFTKTILDSCIIAEDGQFQFQFNIEETRKAQVTWGKYEGCLFVEPGKTYSINLPEYEQPSKADLLNPYYQPQELLLSFNSLPKDDINQQIIAFEDAFDRQWMQLISADITPQRIEQAIANIDSLCPPTKNTFMEQYRNYRYALMVNLHASSAPDLSIRTYFLDQPVLYHQPAYWEAFEAIFPHFEHLTGLHSNLALFELAVMQKIESGDLSTENLKHITLPKNKEIAHFIEQKRATLQKGHPIDLGQLINLKGDTIVSSDLHFPKAYILFTNTQLNECEGHVTYADKMSKKYRNKCLFLVIFTDVNEKNIERVCKNSDQTFFFSSNKNPHLKKQFNIGHVPAYFVLDGNSKLMQVPAPEPQNFEP